MKIALIGECTSKNLGEPLLHDCLEYSCKLVDSKIEFVRLDIFGSNLKLNWLNRVIHKIKWKLLKLVNNMDIKTNYFSLCDKFYTSINNCDGVIVVGAGTIKYDVRCNFAPHYLAIAMAAEKANIPVFINCAGIESKCNESDNRFLMFSRALSDSSFKIITTRDDIDSLRGYVKNKGTELAKISDVGVWAAETFNLQKDTTSTVVGIGVITPKRFEEFGRKITPEKYIRELENIIIELNKQGIQWNIFTNGDREDTDFAISLCEKLDIDNDNLVIPTNTENLVKTIAGFKGIITSRLHSCIVAYSLNIPFVAIAWNNKLEYFAKDLTIEERIIKDENYTATEIVLKINKAIDEGYDQKHRDEFRESSLLYARKYVEYIQEDRREKEK